MEQISRHQCFVYEGAPSEHLGSLAAIISKKLNDNYRCLYLNSPEMVEAMRSSLQSLKVKVADETERTRLLLTSATAVSPDGRFDADLMMNRLEDAVVQALRDGFKGLFATGDMTWELGAFKDSFATLIDYESRLEKLFHKQPALCGVCQYHQDTLSPEMMRAGLLSHQAVFINDTLSRINSFYSDSTLEAEKKVHKNAQELDEAVSELFKSKESLSGAC
jgi:hypothetical protein